MQNAIVLTNGLLQKSDAKTAHGLIRGTERYKIVAVVDDESTAGLDAGTLLDGHRRGIPVFASLEACLATNSPIDCLIIGIATVGGILPAHMLEVIKKAITSRLSIVNGLHEFLSEKPEITALAEQYGVSLTDIRKPKHRQELQFWSGEIYKVKAPIVAVLGMDCAVGKRTTARILKETCRQNNIKAEMIYTGQTGWMQGGKYGFIFDSTLNDFISGELEHAIVSCWKETNSEILFIEGQSSLRNPSGPCGFEYIISGNAKHVVLVTAPKRKYFDDDIHWGEIPSVESEIKLIEQLGAKVIGLVLNTKDCTPEEAASFRKQYEESLKIPILLPIEEGLSAFIPTLKNLLA
jgi:uncharacterized NAD-dependent epimerase/dehydratase family protein